MFEILILVFGAIGVGFFLIFLLALSDRRRKDKGVVANEPSLTQIQFEKACVAILEGMKLEIESIERTDENTLEIKAKNPTPFVGGNFFVYSVYLPPNEVVTSAEILEVSNMVIQDRLSKAILMTNTRFTEDLPAISELAPMEFIDEKRLTELMSQYRILPA